MDQIWPSARVGRGDNKAYICTLFGEEDEKLVVTYKTSFKSVNGSSLVIDGENIESNNIPVVTGADILHALDSDAESVESESSTHLFTSLYFLTLTLTRSHHSLFKLTSPSHHHLSSNSTLLTTFTPSETLARTVRPALALVVMEERPMFALYLPLVGQGQQLCLSWVKDSNYANRVSTPPYYVLLSDAHRKSCM